MPIEPDTKDWTWVLERPCPECGFDASDYPRASIGEVVRSTGSAWASELDRPDATVRSREDRWSVLEYACHVRDVFRIFDVRLGLLLTEDDPGFPDWDQDRAAAEGGYADQDPAGVRSELIDAAAVLGGHFDTVSGDQWGRTGRRSNGSAFTVDTLGSYLIHDPIHHLWDVSSR
jgi:hypothetical protein